MKRKKGIENEKVCMILYVCVCIVAHISRVWINRVRLPVLHMVS